MRNLILVAVILQLVITVHILGFEFGDLIAFHRSNSGISYLHFAVYVGNKSFPGKKDGDDIFERLKKFPPACVFSKLSESSGAIDTPANYLDGYKNYMRGTEEEMTERIIEKRNKCGLYTAIHNNCEHLATYVRYGVKLSLQLNLPVGYFSKKPRLNIQGIREHIRETCPINPRSTD